MGNLLNLRRNFFVYITYYTYFILFYFILLHYMFRLYLAIIRCMDNNFLLLEHCIITALEDG
jgi:hypothetical protein